MTKGRAEEGHPLFDLLGDEPLRIVFDAEEFRPGCALLQAALGGSPHIASLFDSSVWLLAPTPGMKTYGITKGQLAELIERVHEQHREGGRKAK